MTSNKKIRTAKIPVSNVGLKSDEKNIPQKINRTRAKSIYGPLKEEFLVFVEFLNIAEKQIIGKREICMVIEHLETIMKKCEFYLKYQLMKAELNG